MPSPPIIPVGATAVRNRNELLNMKEIPTNLVAIVRLVGRLAELPGRHADCVQIEVGCMESQVAFAL